MSLIPINVPPEVNTWEVLQEESKSQPDLTHVVAAMRDMFDHFDIPEGERSNLGDVVQRFSMMLAVNNGVKLQTDDRKLHLLADMTEWFQRRAEVLLAQSFLGGGYA